jgi:hypothetical protein
MTKGREASERACRQLPASTLRADDHWAPRPRRVNRLSARAAPPRRGRTPAGSAPARSGPRQRPGVRIAARPNKGLRAGGRRGVFAVDRPATQRATADRRAFSAAHGIKTESSRYCNELLSDYSRDTNPRRRVKLFPQARIAERITELVRSHRPELEQLVDQTLEHLARPGRRAAARRH